MKQIDDSILTRLAFGCIRAVKSRTGWQFFRFTEKQTELFSAYNPYYPEPFFDGYFLRNCYTDAGISLDFETDSSSVTFHIADNTPANGSVNNLFDIFVNGKLRLFAEEPGQYTVTLRGKNRVTLCFPFFSHLTVSGIEVDDGSYVIPHTFRKKWLILGDSITHGCTATHPGLCYGVRAALRYDVEILNQGNAGYIHDDRIIDAEMPFEPDVITSAYGINDLGRKSLANNIADTERYFAELRCAFPAGKIYMISPIWAAFLDGKDQKQRRDAMYDIYTAVSEKLNITMIDGRKLVPHNRKYYLEDGVHPCDKGFSYYAFRLGRILFDNPNTDDQD